MSYKSQLIGFIKRNYILKRRNKFQTMPEIVNPIMLVAFLILINTILPTNKYEAATFALEKFPPETYLFSKVRIYLQPDNNETRRIGSFIKTEYKNTIIIVYFNNTNDLFQRYLDDAKNSSMFDTYLGVEISQSNFPFEYTIYHPWDTMLFENKAVKLTVDSRTCRKDSKSVLNEYDGCGGNKFVYRGLSKLQYILNRAIKTVS
jgi:hypothetical protein